MVDRDALVELFGAKRRFSPVTCAPMHPDPVSHRVKPFVDDGGPITFQWHFKKGMLRPRMSALELAEFVIDHMPHILPFFSGQPRVQQEFRTLFHLIDSSVVKVPMIVTEQQAMTGSAGMGGRLVPETPRVAKIASLTELGTIPWVAVYGVVDVLRDSVGRPVWVVGGGAVVATIQPDADTQEWADHRAAVVKVTDRIVPWIRAVTRGIDDDVIHMSLFDRTEQPAGPSYFIITP